MRILKKIGLALGIALLAFGFAGVANAVVFDNRGAFEATLGTSITDDYASPGYFAGDFIDLPTVDIHTDTSMSAVFGETRYTSTGFVDINFINRQTTNPGYCAGCNGSFLLDFTATSLGGPNGVFGVGFDLPTSNNDDSYIAFVTFGDGSTTNIAVADTSLAGGFWGITDALLITSIHFGGLDGATTQDGAFSIDNLTIGTQSLPEPATLALFGLGLVGLGLAARRRRPALGLGN